MDNTLLLPLYYFPSLTPLLIGGISMLIIGSLCVPYMLYISLLLIPSSSSNKLGLFGQYLDELYEKKSQSQGKIKYIEIISNDNISE